MLLTTTMCVCKTLPRQRVYLRFPKLPFPPASSLCMGTFAPVPVLPPSRLRPGKGRGAEGMRPTARALTRSQENGIRKEAPTFLLLFLPQALENNNPPANL